MKPARRARGQERMLVLRRFPYGESSLVLHVLGEHHGRLALLAKGAYRPSSGYFAVFDLFDTLRVSFGAPRGEGLALVTGAEVLVRRPTIARDLEAYRAASALLELAHLAGRDGMAEPGLFRWLEEGLELLTEGRIPTSLVSVYGDLTLLAVTGLEPALAHCASCGTRAGSETEAAFSPALGGRLCARCASEARARGKVLEFQPAALLRIAASLRHATPTTLAGTRLAPEPLARLRAFVGRFLEYHLETRLRSRRALHPAPSGSA